MLKMPQIQRENILKRPIGTMLACWNITALIKIAYNVTLCNTAVTPTEWLMTGKIWWDSNVFIYQDVLSFHIFIGKNQVSTLAK